MQTTLIITRNDFSGRVELSTNIPDAKINNRILEAEDFDLRELLGDAFYWDFIASFNNDGTQKDSASAEYKLLYTGGAYTINSINYTFYGVKPVMVFYTTARLIRALDMNLTPTGVMVKKNEFSDHLDSNSINQFANQYKNQGLAYWNMCEKYLDATKMADKTKLPLWKPGCFFGEEQAKVAPKVTALGGCDDERYNNYSTIKRF